ncbi:hypothetical protein DM860_011608 [Cuscuta australis]|uniref:Biotin carboxyl carrier protein of acetyl-CoA carboxylase n=1 Tax=Cuscuta australis TaxID=267555 RepID=A0A328D051_9ASTE|nr:hypothetical protein DM860_011608 [Cuscuta australis]
MASFTVPSAKSSVLFGTVSSQSHLQLPQQTSVCFLTASRSGPALLPLHQVVLKVSAQLNEGGAVEKSSNSKLLDEGEVPVTEKEVPDVLSISTFLSQAANLVKLVDSKDIAEVHLKQMDCEIIIKKEALPQANIMAAPASIGQPSFHQPIAQQLLPPAPAPAPAAAPSLPPTAPAKPSSSHHQQKAPMAGTFYHAPSPGAPPFVKVGDKVSKGQLLCIIEAMKLMNEIEAEISGTIVEMHVENGKPISINTPLFSIAP